MRSRDFRFLDDLAPTTGVTKAYPGGCSAETNEDVTVDQHVWSPREDQALSFLEGHLPLLPLQRLRYGSQVISNLSPTITMMVLALDLVPKR